MEIESTKSPTENMNTAPNDAESLTLSEKMQLKLNELDQLRGGPEILRSFLKTQHQKNLKVIEEGPEPQNKDEWNTWHNLHAAIQHYRSADDEEIRKVRSEIGAISLELVAYIDKEIGYISFEEAYELGPILGFLPVTSKQLLERNGTKLYNEIHDLTKSYVILIDTRGRHKPQELSEVAASKLYSKPDESGQEIYKVNLAHLVQMSAKKKVPQKKRPLEVERESGIKKDNKQENGGGEPSKKVFIERDNTVKKEQWYKDVERRLDKQDERQDKQDEKLSKIAKKQKSHGSQLNYRLKKQNKLEKKQNNQNEEINNLKNNTANLENKVDDVKDKVDDVKDKIDAVNDRMDKFQKTFTKWFESNNDMMGLLFENEKSALKRASKSPARSRSEWNK